MIWMRGKENKLSVIYDAKMEEHLLFFSDIEAICCIACGEAYSSATDSKYRISAFKFRLNELLVGKCTHKAPQLWDSPDPAAHPELGGLDSRLVKEELSGVCGKTASGLFGGFGRARLREDVLCVGCGRSLGMHHHRCEHETEEKKDQTAHWFLRVDHSGWPAAL